MVIENVWLLSVYYYYDDNNIDGDYDYQITLIILCFDAEEKCVQGMSPFSFLPLTTTYILLLNPYKVVFSYIP